MFRELEVLWKSWRVRFEGGRGGRGSGRARARQAGPQIPSAVRELCRGRARGTTRQHSELTSHEMMISGGKRHRALKITLTEHRHWLREPRPEW